MIRVILGKLLFVVCLVNAVRAVAGSLEGDFRDPPASWKTRPLWFWNAPPSKPQTDVLMKRCQDAGYYGFGILPTQKMDLAFMSPAYLDRYQEAVDKAAQLGLKMCLYDEFWFPSGSAGGLLAQKYPEALGKRLDMTAYDVSGPQAFVKPIPDGRLMAAVAMHAQDLRRIDLAGYVRDGRLAWNVPAGNWKVMFFLCVPDGARTLVDYLDPEAVGRFIELTYQAYYDKFPQHFGKTIDSAFYDEPTFHWIQGGRAWTPAFNEKFRRRHGGDPSLLYPALWMDIGPETASARNALFGMRAELIAEGFVKPLAEWCARHGIELTGHMDQEEVVNPVGLCGDLIKVFKHQHIPGIDQVFSYGRASKAYKVVSSAAANYNRPRVMCECYGAMNLPPANLYKEAMDQFAKGVNMMVPHAVWYSSQGVIFPPELSPLSAKYGPELPEYNRYMGRLQRILQHGRHVADVAVLYPIASLQAGYRFGVGKPYTGGIIPPEADYMNLGDWLALDLRCDFTFLHPETLDERCTVEGATLRLNFPEQFEQYQVLLLPGSTTIHASNLRKIKRFYDAGGRVIATTRLPERSVEPGHDAEVRALIAAMFGDREPTKNASTTAARARFVPLPSPETLRAALAAALPVPDVAWQPPPKVAGGNLSYIHKVVQGRDFYFFGNSSETLVDTHVRLRGGVVPEFWDPHTGRIEDAEYRGEEAHGQKVCRVRLRLPPVRSLFVVGKSQVK